MEKLSVCRICLGTDVQHVVKNLELQEIYEKLTKIPTDMRPLALCYICFSQLTTSHRFMLKCLKAEQLLARMMDQMLTNEDKVLDPALIDRSDFIQLTISPVEQIVQIDSTVLNNDSIGLEIMNTPISYHHNDEVEFEVKLEEHPITQEFPETANSTDAEPYNEQTPSDPDDIPLTYIKKELEEAIEQEEDRISNKRQNLFNEADNIAKKPKLKPEVNESTQVTENGYTNADNDNDEASNLRRNIKINKKFDFEKKYMCQQNGCTQGFAVKSALIIHTRLHTGEKPYVCNVCQKGFTQSGNLTAHELIHTGEKPYVCKVCKKGFTQNNTLIEHERIHTGERPFVCNKCNKGFSRKNDLTKHERVHIRREARVYWV